MIEQRVHGVQSWLEGIDAVLVTIDQLDALDTTRVDLRALRQEIASQAEAIDRANDTPHLGSLDDFQGWAQAGHYRFSYLAEAFEYLNAFGERLERLVAVDPKRAKEVAATNLMQFESRARDLRTHEAYEAATAFERAAAWLKSFAEQ